MNGVAVASGVAGAIVASARAALLAAGLALHGLWDVAHPSLLPASDAVPAFCLGVDLPLAVWVYLRWPPGSRAPT